MSRANYHESRKDLEARARRMERTIRDLRSALGTEEVGDALVEVARNAHRAERNLAATQRRLLEEDDR